MIFVVDDEAPIVDVVAAFLENNGHTVVTFTSPIQALDTALAHKPDVLLSDFRMSEMDGLTFAVKLLELHPACRVLIMSGDTDEAGRHPARKQFEFLQKPLDLSQLLAKVNSVLREIQSDPDSL